EISAVGAESCDLELKIIFEDHNHAEMRAYRVGATKELLHYFWSRIGREIDIFRHPSPNEIADTAASPISNVPGSAEAIDNRARSREHWSFFAGARHRCMVAAPAC